MLYGADRPRKVVLVKGPRRPPKGPSLLRKFLADRRPDALDFLFSKAALE